MLALVLVLVCWCAGAGAGALLLMLVRWCWCAGVGAGVLVRWCWCWCAGAGAGVLVLVRWCWCWCAGAGALVLVLVCWCAGAAHLHAAMSTKALLHCRWLPATTQATPHLMMLEPSGHTYLLPSSKWTLSGPKAVLKPGSPTNNTSGRRLMQGPDRNIIGADDRFSCYNRQYPYKAAGMLELTYPDGTFICSATLIAPNYVLTAAHCIFDWETGLWVNNMTFVPGRVNNLDGKNIRPFGRTGWSQVYKLAQFVGDYVAIGQYYDMAVIKLDQPIGERLWLQRCCACCQLSAAALMTLQTGPALTESTIAVLPPAY
jgi:hypothetical protein